MSPPRPMLVQLCNRHLDSPHRQLEDSVAEACPVCLIEELRRTSAILRQASETIRTLEEVRWAARRYLRNPDKGRWALERTLDACDRTREARNAG